MKKSVFFFSCHFSLSVTILGWSNAHDVMGILLGTAWIKSSLAWIHLHYSSDLPVQGALWKEGKHGKIGECMEIGGQNGIAKGDPSFMHQDVGVNCWMPKGHCR